MGNRLEPLQRRTFRELGMGERAHLQEWIESRPDVLGEELIILCKEYAPAGTRTRLDLLALDRAGKLVVIETKRNAASGEILWQAARYAAHVAAMDTRAIVEAHQRYLDRSEIAADAFSRIQSFLGSPSDTPLHLNPIASQRIFLVASDFPKELGATVLWMREMGLQLECLLATPVTGANGLFLDLRTVIPGQEEDFRPPSALYRSPSHHQRRPVSDETAHYRKEFWDYVLTRLRAAGDSKFEHAKPSGELNVAAPSSVPGAEFRLVIGQTFAQVELRLRHIKRARNAEMFRRLREHKWEVEYAFGAHLNWRAPSNWPIRTLAFPRQFESSDRANWPAITLWFIEHAAKLQNATTPYLLDQ